MKKSVFSFLMIVLVIVTFAGFSERQEIKNSRVRQWKGGVGLNASVTNKFAASMDNLLLEWNTFLGGSSGDDGYDIVIDGNGNFYVTGVSDASWGSPVNPFAGESNAFVAKLDSNGVLQWNTFLGSNININIYRSSLQIAIDGNGNIYVAGSCKSTWGSPVNPFAGGSDSFVAKLDSNGVPQWNTFLGGSSDDYGWSIAIDAGGNIYVTGGSANSWGSPVIPFTGDEEVNAFVAGLNSNGVLLWNTFMGGGDDQNVWGTGIATDGSGNIYVTGTSAAMFGDVSSPFVIMLNSNGVRQWTTVLNGTTWDRSNSIAVDISGNIYLTGESHLTYVDSDAFVASLNSDGVLQWRTFMGGRHHVSGRDIAINGSGDIYIIGTSFTTWGSPVIPFKGSVDEFVAKLNSNGVLKWNAFLGERSNIIYSGIVVDNGGHIYMTGGSSGTWGNPVSPFIGGKDAFVAQIIDADTIPPYKITLNRDSLNFGTIGNVSTSSQAFLVGSDSDNPVFPIWSITNIQTGFSCDPTSGTGPTLVTVSVNPTGLAPGTYSGVITVSDPIAVNSPQTIGVTLNVNGPGQTTGPFGEYSTPVDGSLVSGSIPFTGWALDDIGVESVKLYLVGGSTSTYIGDAVFIEGARPDVELAYPRFPMNYRAGWCYMMLTNSLPGSGNGTFTITAIAIDREGNQVSLGAKTITVDNAHAVKPFGAIDTPGQNGTVSGRSYRNNGWVLTPPPNLLPTDGTTINVWVDGVRLGHPRYNLYRPDVSSLFPGYANSNGAGGYFDFDTTAYENGMHSIFWTATDNAGNTDGIGSRYFYILDTGSSHISAVSAPMATTVAKTKPSAAPKFKKDIIAVPISYDGPVKLKKGFNDNSRLSEEVLPDADGIVSIRCHELERIELQVSQAGNKVEGYLVVGQRLKRLPIGATLDSGTGTFNWIPGPGFIGTYRLVFVETDKKGEQSRKKISIIIIPKFSNSMCQRNSSE